MGLTYTEMMKRVQINRGTVCNSRIGVTHKWNYAEPYKMICLEFKEVGDSKIEVTYGIKVGEEFVEKSRLYSTEGKAAYYWEQFIEAAFPYASEETTLDMLLGRPFAAEIVKNEGYDNIKVLSGYRGEFPDEVEGLE